ncbi:hypothetical protein CTA2_6635 [Colletotrichum tanaceti]|uniref:Uncharacterized protein n=1 Tax=Colletotrichum tanaceti TaxID=1306861 RepID=A0A4U6XF53_9PEZI|nr:hypothetical protein CTA2_6635 [Colletotrichum tanaceti]TKW53842.1 hypothetical protein CTA1_7379 [Colletotrichum tanaceti]
MRLLLSTVFFITLLLLGTLVRSAAVDRKAVAELSKRSDVSGPIARRDPLAKKDKHGWMSNKKKDRHPHRKHKKCKKPYDDSCTSDSDFN